MAQPSMFNLDGIRKAAQTAKTTGAIATQSPTMPIMRPGKPATVTTPNPLPQAAITAAGMSRSGPVPTIPDAAKVAAQNMMSATSNVTVPNMSRANQALDRQANLVNTPFTFNPETDPSYQAALRAAQQNLQVNQKNTNAQLRATGQGKSSYSETVANQLANQSAENIANNVLPIYAQQAYQQYKDSIGNQRNLYQDYNQQDFQNPITESQVTGNYLPAAAQQAYQQLLEKKAAAESNTITRDQRSAISAEADQIRNMLKGMGIDISGLGADKTAAQAGSAPIGIRTLAGQAQDQSVKNANLDAATAVSNMTGRVITPQTDWQGLVRQANDPNTPLNANQSNFNRQQDFNESQQAWNNQFDQAKFEEDTRRYGLDYALQQQQINISAMNANTSRAGNEASIANNQFGQLMDVWKATGVAPTGLEQLGVQSGTPYSAGAAAKATEPKTYENYQSEIEKVKSNNKNPAVTQDYIKSLPVSNYEKYRAWIASGYEWPANVEVPKPGE